MELVQEAVVVMAAAEAAQEVADLVAEVMEEAAMGVVSAAALEADARRDSSLYSRSQVCHGSGHNQACCARCHRYDLATRMD